MLINVHSNQITFIFFRNFKFYLIWHNTCICSRIFWKCKKYKIPRGVRTLNLLIRSNTLNPLHYADRDDWGRHFKIILYFIVNFYRKYGHKIPYQIKWVVFRIVKLKRPKWFICTCTCILFMLTYLNIIIDDIFLTNFFFYFLQLLDHV